MKRTLSKRQGKPLKPKEGRKQGGFQYGQYRQEGQGYGDGVYGRDDGYESDKQTLGLGRPLIGGLEPEPVPIVGRELEKPKKGQPMVNASEIREHMEIKGSDGQHIGTVDRVEGDRIKLTKSDPAAGGEHHYMDLRQVTEIKDGAVWAAKSAEECKRMLQ